MSPREMLRRKISSLAFSVGLVKIVTNVVARGRLIYTPLSRKGKWTESYRRLHRRTSHRDGWLLSIDKP